MDIVYPVFPLLSPHKSSIFQSIIAYFASQYYIEWWLWLIARSFELYGKMKNVKNLVGMQPCKIPAPYKTVHYKTSQHAPTHYPYFKSICKVKVWKRKKGKPYTFISYTKSLEQCLQKDDGDKTLFPFLLHLHHDECVSAEAKLWTKCFKKWLQRAVSLMHTISHNIYNMQIAPFITY